jgi:hypothetical protein
MRKTIFTLLFVAAATMSFAAGNAELFQVDEQELNAEFAQLNELESFVNANEGITISEINQENPLVQNVANASDVLGVLGSLRGDSPLGIPSFLWGFCLNVAGVAIVYFVADDRDETKKAFTGCAISAALYIIWVVVYVLIIGNSFLFFG